MQTESFLNETGGMRVVWEARAREGGSTGSFKLSIHSAVSGRTLAMAVDHHGAGRGTAYVSDDPHMCYSLVESTGLDWTFTVDEAIPARVIEPSSR